jgi:hypothetical protein
MWLASNQSSHHFSYDTKATHLLSSLLLPLFNVRPEVELISEIRSRLSMQKPVCVGDLTSVYHQHSGRHFILEQVNQVLFTYSIGI